MSNTFYLILSKLFLSKPIKVDEYSRYIYRTNYICDKNTAQQDLDRRSTKHAKNYVNKINVVICK